MEKSCCRLTLSNPLRAESGTFFNRVPLEAIESVK